MNLDPPQFSTSLALAQPLFTALSISHILFFLLFKEKINKKIIKRRSVKKKVREI
jgi:hypothetical protein